MTLIQFTHIYFQINGGIHLTTWTALFRKDFRLTRTVFFVGLIINFLFLLLTLYVENKTGDTLYMFIPLLVAVALHMLYVPIMVFISLRVEANQQNFWLHNPQSSATLLLSKVLNGVVMALISLAVLYMMAGWLIISRFNLIEEYWRDTWLAALLMVPHIIAISITNAIWVIFLWSLYYALRNRIGRWTSLVLLGAIIIPWRIFATFETTHLFEQLTHWISLEMKFPTFMKDPIPVYAGEYVYVTIVTIGVFYLCTWIMDRKAEV
jgi:hypothetical protein